MTKQHRTLSIYQYVWDGGLKFNSVAQINCRENQRGNQELVRFFLGDVGSVNRKYESLDTFRRVNT
jgi:hypothetical protein